MTSKHMKWAAEYVKKLTDPKQKMLVAEAFIDASIEFNNTFNLQRFLSAADISLEQWEKERVFIERRKQ